MSDCCNPQERHDGAEKCSACPRCGRTGWPVQIVTLKSLLTPAAMRRLDVHEAYHFCRVAACPVVYFSGDHIFTKDEVTVRVFQKESDDPLPVCYCFGITKQQVADEIERTGQSTAVQLVSRYVKDGKCACELRNPQGRCCLGNLARVAGIGAGAAGTTGAGQNHQTRGDCHDVLHPPSR